MDHGNTQMPEHTNGTESKSHAAAHLDEKRQFLRLVQDVAGKGAKSADPEAVGHAFVDVVRIVMDGVMFRKGSYEAVPVTAIDDPSEYY